MSRSEIFESFIKIAQEKGLVSNAESAEHTEKDFSETNPRMDSLTIEQISKLYNIKPSLPKDMEYKKNIMEDAHPDSLVISPSHDKLNGLIENNIERQNILLHIVHKEPDGHLTQRKYAEKELIMSLVRVANELDQRDQDGLRKLADVCLLQASKKKLTKVAFPFLIAGIAALVAAIYTKQHIKFHSDGFTQDYQKALGEIDDLLTSNSNWGVGYSYTPAFIQMVNNLRLELSKLNAGVQKVLPLFEKIETPHTGSELKEMAQQPETQEIVEAMKEFQTLFDEVGPYIMGVINDFNNEGFKQRAIAQKGFISSLVDSTEVLHGGAGLMADDFDDVKHALQTLQSDIENIAKGLQTYQSVKQQATQQLQEAHAETASTFGGAPQTVPPSENPQENETGSLDEEGKGLLGAVLPGMGQ